MVHLCCTSTGFVPAAGVSAVILCRGVSYHPDRPDIAGCTIARKRYAGFAGCKGTGSQVTSSVGDTPYV